MIRHVYPGSGFFLTGFRGTVMNMILQRFLISAPFFLYMLQYISHAELQGQRRTGFRIRIEEFEYFNPKKIVT
jgi:hypothetical protein